MIASMGPLTGLHVIDMSTFVAGPSCTLALAQLGAHVLRIDPLGGAIDSRRHPLAPDGSSLYWDGLNKNKTITQLDLRSGDGRAVVHRLLSTPGPGHGILVTNAVGQRWLDFDALRAVRPDLIMVHLEGRSDGGSAVDYTINCETGLADVTGPAAHSEPINSVLPSWDLLAGLHAAVSILAAHAERDRTGQGAHIRVSLADVAAATLGHLGYIGDATLNSTVRTREGNSLYGTYGHDFRLADGRRVMIVALTRRHWQSLVRVAGIEDLIAGLETHHGVSLNDEGARYTHRAVITAMLSPWFEAQALADLSVTLTEAQVPWGEYRSLTEMAESDNGLVARSEIFSQIEHPAGGAYAAARAVARTPAWTLRPPIPANHLDPAEALSVWANGKE